MKRILTPAVALFFMLLCLPEFSSVATAQGGSVSEENENPIMVIRCRNFDGEALKDTKTSVNQSKMMTGCPDGYTATDDGGCVPICAPRTFGTGSSAFTVEYEFNPVTGLCEEINCDPFGSIDCSSYCQGDIFDFGCDPCLSDAAGSNTENYLGYDAALGACYKACFDGVVTFDPPVVDCENPNDDGLVSVELCFKSADPTMPLQDGQQVPITDIANCLNDLGEEYFSLLPTVISTTDNYGIGVAMDGEICIEFLADPNEPIVVNLSNQVEPLTIPLGCEVIPSMGQWALLIFAMLLSSLGLIFIAKED